MTKKSAQKYIANVPKSGDSLVDLMFAQFVSFLRKETVRVARKRRLVNPDDPHRRVIRGLMDPDIHPSGNWVQILINPAKNTHRNRDEEVETLVHELAHVILPKASERHILRMERILSQKLSAAQRRYLKAFLPRHEIKKYPRLSVDGKIATA